MLEFLGIVFLIVLGVWILKNLFVLFCSTAGGVLKFLIGLFLLVLFFPVLLVFLPVAIVVGFVVISVVFLVVTALVYAFLGIFV